MDTEYQNLIASKSYLHVHVSKILFNITPLFNSKLKA